MNILISGASGLVGTALRQQWEAGGHAILPLERRDAPPRPPAGTRPVRAWWNPEDSAIDLSQAGPVDAVVHLAGHPIACRWTRANKRRIRDSRVRGTDLLSRALARLEQPPGILISASAVGYYGDAGDRVLREDSPAGSGFLPEVAQAWEAAADPARQAGWRVLHPRLGVVLSPRGGALAKMLPAFRLGMGGRLGSGRQYWSWISLEDVVGAMDFFLTPPSGDGPFNLVAPTPVTNGEFTRTLGKVLGRPTVLPVPRPLARLALGQMAEDALLASARAEPARLLQAGYSFRHPDLEPALRDLLL